MQPCHKGVQRERLAHDFAGQSVVCFTPCKRSRKNLWIFLTAGVGLQAERGRVIPTPALCVYGVFSRRVAAAEVSPKRRHHRHCCHPQGRTAAYRCAATIRQPDLTAIALPSERNHPAAVLSVVIIADMVFKQKPLTVFIHPFGQDIRCGFCLSHSG